MIDSLIWLLYHQYIISHIGFVLFFYYLVQLDNNFQKMEMLDYMEF